MSVDTCAGVWPTYHHQLAGAVCNGSPSEARAGDTMPKLTIMSARAASEINLHVLIMSLSLCAISISFSAALMSEPNGSPPLAVRRRECGDGLAHRWTRGDTSRAQMQKGL